MAIENVKCTCSYKDIVEVKDGKSVKGRENLAQPIEMVVPFDFGGNLDEMVTLHGKDQVFALAKAKGVIAVQDTARRLLASGKTPSDVLEFMKTFKFGQTVRTPVDAKAAAKSALTSMSPEERKAFLAELQAAAKSLG